MDKKEHNLSNNQQIIYSGANLQQAPPTKRRGLLIGAFLLLGVAMFMLGAGSYTIFYFYYSQPDSLEISPISNQEQKFKETTKKEDTKPEMKSGIEPLITLPDGWQKMIPELVKEDYSKDYIYFDNLYSKAISWLEKEDNTALILTNSDPDVTHKGISLIQSETTGEEGILYDPSGNPYYYSGSGDNHVQIIRNGLPIGGYPYSGGLSFSVNGLTEAYIASEDGEKSFLVVNGERTIRTYENIDEIWISDDGQQVAAEVREGGFEPKAIEYIIWNDFTSLKFGIWGNTFQDITFSPDGKKIAYIAYNGSALYINNEKIATATPNGRILKPGFTTDSSKVWFINETGNTKFMASSKGDEGKHYDSINWDGTLASDGESPIYFAKNKTNPNIIVNGNREKILPPKIEIALILTGKEDPPRMITSTPTVYIASNSDNNKQLSANFFLADNTAVYITRKDSNNNSTSEDCLFVDDIEKFCHQEIHLRLYASTNLNTFAYRLKSSDGMTMVINGEEGQLYKSVSQPSISSDGSSYAYVATTLNGEKKIIVNGVERAVYVSPAKRLLLQYRNTAEKNGVGDQKLADIIKKTSWVWEPVPYDTNPIYYSYGFGQDLNSSQNNDVSENEIEVDRVWRPIISDDGQYFIYSLIQKNTLKRVIEKIDSNLN